jgi:hypothetical protein
LVKKNRKKTICSCSVPIVRLAAFIALIDPSGLRNPRVALITAQDWTGAATAPFPSWTCSLQSRFAEELPLPTNRHTGARRLLIN